MYATKAELEAKVILPIINNLVTKLLAELRRKANDPSARKWYAYSVTRNDRLGSRPLRLRPFVGYTRQQSKSSISEEDYAKFIAILKDYYFGPKLIKDWRQKFLPSRTEALTYLGTSQRFGGIFVDLVKYSRYSTDVEDYFPRIIPVWILDEIFIEVISKSFGEDVSSLSDYVDKLIEKTRKHKINPDKPKRFFDRARYILDSEGEEALEKFVGKFASELRTKLFNKYKDPYVLAVAAWKYVINLVRKRLRERMDSIQAELNYRPDNYGLSEELANQLSGRKLPISSHVYYLYGYFTNEQASKSEDAYIKHFLSHFVTEEEVKYPFIVSYEDFVHFVIDHYLNGTLRDYICMARISLVPSASKTTSLYVNVGNPKLTPVVVSKKSDYLRRTLALYDELHRALAGKLEKLKLKLQNPNLPINLLIRNSELYDIISKANTLKKLVKDFSVGYGYTEELYDKYGNLLYVPRITINGFKDLVSKVVNKEIEIEEDPKKLEEGLTFLKTLEDILKIYTLHEEDPFKGNDSLKLLLFNLAELAKVLLDTKVENLYLLTTYAPIKGPIVSKVGTVDLSQIKKLDLLDKKSLLNLNVQTALSTYDEVVQSFSVTRLPDKSQAKADSTVKVIKTKTLDLEKPSELEDDDLI